MKIFSETHSYNYSWSNISLALFEKYPNPLARHVKSTDILDRFVDSNGILHTRRLVFKESENPLPSWLSSMIKCKGGFCVEDSWVDGKASKMKISTNNLTLKNLFEAKEVQTVTEGPQGSNSALIKTDYITHYKGRTFFAARIEQFIMNRLKEKMQMSRHAIIFASRMIREKISLNKYSHLYKRGAKVIITS